LSYGRPTKTPFYQRRCTIFPITRPPVFVRVFPITRLPHYPIQVLSALADSV